ncbi:MAG: MHS family MFS transporter [Pseudonocardiales bacterium]|nr:MHS family MFS transporter [Pseudonocardiales bacterium]MBV9652257.1 MHS family MFS transporter [Pseudonocardiales bacterium]
MRRVALASCVGTTIEFYDFYLYGTAAALVFPKVFFPALGSTAGTVASFATFAVAFVARPVGAMIFGHYGDRYGRKQTLIATLLLMGMATVLIGLLPGATTIGIAAPVLLVMLRFAQGLAVGGEWAGATLLAAEYAPPGQRGWYAMFPQLGAPIGLALSSATFLITGLTLGNTDQPFLDYGWRVPFLISTVLLGAGMYVRWRIEETPVFRHDQRQRLATRTPLREALSQAPREILLSAGTLTMIFALFYTGTTYLTSYGTSPTGAALSRALVLSIGIGAGAAMAAGVILSAIASDRLGRRIVVMLTCGAAVVWSLLLFPLLNTRTPIAFGVSVIVTLTMMGLAYGPVGALLPETFPTRFRYTGAGISYNLAGIAGGAIPPLVAAPLAAAFGSFSIGIMLCAISLLSLLCTKALVETKDQDLQDLRLGFSARY